MKDTTNVENKDAAPKRRAVDQTPEDRDRELRANAPRVQIVGPNGEEETTDAYTARERVTAAGSAWSYAPTEGTK